MMNTSQSHCLIYKERAVYGTQGWRKRGTRAGTMTEAEHNRPIPKLFSNRPSASAAEVFGLLREPIIFFENNM